MSQNRRGFWCAMALVVASGIVCTAESLRILPLVRDHQVLVSFELLDAYTDEVRDAVSSGLRTTFTYNVDLRMDVPFWADRTVATTLVSIANDYDSLTGRHSLARRIDGRVIEALVTEDEDVVREWFTKLTRLPLCETSRLHPNRDYYVRVSARSRPQVGSVLAWANAIRGQATFTFIP